MKKYYSRASKAQFTRSITKQQRRESITRKTVERYNAIQAEVSGKTTKLGQDKEEGQDKEDKSTKPEDHYHISDDIKQRVNVYEWPGEDLVDDPAVKVCRYYHSTTAIIHSRLIRTFYQIFSIIYLDAYWVVNTTATKFLSLLPREEL